MSNYPVNATDVSPSQASANAFIAAAARRTLLKKADKAKKARASLAAKRKKTKKHDPVEHPAHYTGHPSGVECIQITEHFNFCRGNAIKYIWRAGDKGSVVEDLEKARWYIDREIARLNEGAE